MSVARFCICGFLLPPDNGSPHSCPACGRPPAMPAAVPILMSEPVPAGPLTLQAVELDDYGQPIPFAPTPKTRSVAEDDYRRRRADARAMLRTADFEERIERIRRPWDNPWPAAGSFEDCLLYPFRSMFWVLFLAFGWAFAMIVGFAVFVRGFDVTMFLFDAVVGVLIVVLLGYTHRLLQCAYASSAGGKSEMMTWPSFRQMLEWRPGLHALAGVLVGPVPIAALAVWFWLNAGVLGGVDRLILIELATLALTWWMLAIIAHQESGSLRPTAIADWVVSHGWFPTGVLFAAMTAVTIILWMVIGMIGLIVGDEFLALGLFLPFFLIGVFSILFVTLRWLGVRDRRAKKTA